VEAHPVRPGGTARARKTRGLAVSLVAISLLCLAGMFAEQASAAFVPRPLVEKAEANPRATFRVIVQGTFGTSAARVATDVTTEVANDGFGGPRRHGTRKRFASLNGVAAELTGRQILRLARKPKVLAISEDVPVRVTDFLNNGLSNKQLWPYVSGVARSWPSVTRGQLQMPTIAIVDSGIDASRPDFGGRVIENVTMTSLEPNAPGDGRGHGTFVASIAAGSAPRYAGAAPNAPLVSIDVTDDHGMAMTSDVISAADWILANRERLGIRVANFSLHSSQPSTFRFDPLDRAVERLWFDGVVVVAAAGNYGDQQKGVLFAPANDPFIITVGAQDIRRTWLIADDFAAPWSAHGHTLDGFAKPELGAPGRYMVGAVPPESTLPLERPDRVVEPGYLQMSGTSFAAPVVAGAAAYLLAVHPEWTPDQVKGALMATAVPTPLSAPLASGVGEVNAAYAVDVKNPPNPNLALRQFVVPDPEGSSIPVFDEAAWAKAAETDPAWDAATWTSATWTSATWTSTTWTSATWTSAAWEAATWTSATWTSATWTSATWTSAIWTTSTDASWTSNANSEGLEAGGEWIEPAELAAAEAELGLTAATEAEVSATTDVEGEPTLVVSEEVEPPVTASAEVELGVGATAATGL
jgi:serine protease AprX